MSAASTRFEVCAPSIPDDDKLNNNLYLEFVTNVDNWKSGQEEFDRSLVIGVKDDIEKLLKDSFLSTALQIKDVSTSVMNTMLEEIDDEKKGGSAITYVHKTVDSSPVAHQLVLCSLPTKVSRNNHPLSVHTITTFVKNNCLKDGKTTRIIMVLPDDTTPIAPLASAMIKAFPIFSKKTSSSPKQQRKVAIAFVSAGSKSIISDPEKLKACKAVSEGVLLAQRLADTHPEQLNTDTYAKECENIVDILNRQEKGIVTMTQIIGEDLKQQGFGGIYNVGKAATTPPRFILLEYTPSVGSTETVALVGKGILYDTGGLGLKPKVGMCGMKHDMGGSAGMLGAFYSAAKIGVSQHLFCLLCVAENAIGPAAVRNDDIITLFSGKTIEINNSDAEGRLVLGDGVAYASSDKKHLGCDVDCIVDMATLTGAQLITTGKTHASILCNTKENEEKAFEAGLYSGDLCYPILYSPELLMDEFKSSVADMKNSVKDRSNAQCSCAGHFIEAQLHPTYKNGWIHVDMAGPATKDERATGYGVGLILALLNAPGF